MDNLYFWKLLLVGVVFFIPIFINVFGKSFRPIQWLSPVVCCYGLGILMGNLFKVYWNTGLAKELSEVSVMMALPLLLFSTDLMGWFKLARTTLVSFSFVLLSVMIVSFIAGKLFSQFDPEIWKMSGMMVGVFTGGTPNLLAIGKALEVREDVFVMLNAVEMVLGGGYLLFIMSLGVRIISKFLPPFNFTDLAINETDLLNWRHLSFQRKSFHSVVLILLAAVAVGLALGLSYLITGGQSVSVIILGLTAISVIFSFSKKIRNFEGSQELGHYLLLVFCVAVGSLANPSQLMHGSFWYFFFCGFILIGSICLHFLCCFFLKIDRDTAIITSMAGVFGPAFVAPMASVLNNKAILLSGVSTGLVGYAVGNFLGIFIAYLLKG